MEKGFWSTIKKPIIGLAPMDGVSDEPFRFIAAKYGKPDLQITEFTSVEGICHGALKPLQAFIYSEIERPILAQLFGTDPESFYKASLLVCELGFDGIDINMGCPANNVASKGAGAALIRTPELAKEIIRKCQEAALDWGNGKTIESSGLPENIIEYAQIHRPENIIRKFLPVSLKTRIGFSEISIAEWVKHLLETKPVNISIHGRTLKQLYQGEANWEAIKEAATIIHQTETTVLGNGDVQSHEDALNKIKEYEVDGVLIGRASFGNPWIFSSEHSQATKPIQEKLEVALEQSRYFEKVFGTNNFVQMRKHLGWYCKGFSHAKEARMLLMQCNSASEVENAVKKIQEIITEPS